MIVVQTIPKVNVNCLLNDGAISVLCSWCSSFLRYYSCNVFFSSSFDGLFHEIKGKLDQLDVLTMVSCEFTTSSQMLLCLLLLLLWVAKSRCIIAKMSIICEVKIVEGKYVVLGDVVRRTCHHHVMTQRKKEIGKISGKIKDGSAQKPHRKPVLPVWELEQATRFHWKICEIIIPVPKRNEQEAKCYPYTYLRTK